MNTLQAQVKHIDNVQNLNIVKFDFEGNSLSMMSLELSTDIRVGAKVKLGTKPTHVAIAKKFAGEVSYSNQLSAKILDVQNGKLISSIKLQVKNSIIESIITRESYERMHLNIGDEVTALIKANELYLVEVLND